MKMIVEVKMKKILVTFIIAAMGLTLVACGSNDKKEEVANVTEDENTEPTIIVDDEISTGLNESDLYKSFLGLHVSSYDGSDIMVEEDEEEEEDEE